MHFALIVLIVAEWTFPGVAAASETNAHAPYFRTPQGQKPRQIAGAPVVVNSASYLPGVSPGGLATIFGYNLSDVSGPYVADTDPFPTELANVSVTVNGIDAAIYSVDYADGQDIISFQVPFETPTGPGAALIQVFDYDNPVATIQVDSFTEDPGIFLYHGNYAVAVDFPGDYLIGPNQPAYPGDVIIVYTTGLGPVTLDLPDGLGAPDNPLAYTEDAFEVVVNDEDCRVLFSGLAPGFVGLYQLNIVLPYDLPPGDLDIQILSTYANSEVAQLPVQ